MTPPDPTSDEHSSAGGNDSSGREAHDHGSSQDPSAIGKSGTAQVPSDLSDKLGENPELRRYAEDAISYHEESLSENTRRAYESAWRDFCLFCEENEFQPLPATPGTVALYLSFLAKKIDHQTGEVTKEGLSVPTLEQRLSAIAHIHQERGHESPTSTRPVTKVMAGIRRKQRHRPNEAKPLMTYHVKRMVDSLPKNAEIYAEKKRERAKTVSGAELTEGEKRFLKFLQVRNRALILIGFAAALRRSEIASLRFEDLREEPGRGLVIEIRGSKTDQEGEGEPIYVPRLESEYDPVRALDEWRKDAEIDQGPVFRPITRGGNVRKTAVTGRTVGNVVQETVELAGISDSDEYSAHSLRAGHATQATKNGVPAEIAMETTRHASREQFSDYVRNEEQAFDSASSGRLGL